MSRPLRVTLALIGLVLIALSLLILAYALWPLSTASEQFRLAPSLFVPPQSFISWPRSG
jgi:hypothetical protein